MSSSTDLERANILIVDDHPGNLVAVQATLESLQENLVSARSGYEALAAVDNYDFALMLLDVRMAGLDGFETARLIRQRERARETPIIFLTAVQTEVHHARLGYSLGAVDYLYKPFDPELLRDKVRSFVALYRERRARRTAETALEVKDLILGVIGHDLRSPITAICASAELLMRSEQSPDRLAALHRIDGSARRMDRMVRSLVDYARTYFGGGMPIVVAKERMAHIVKRVIDEVRAAHHGRAIVLEVSGDTSGVWDGDRVAQAISNLVLNAVEHALGEVRVSVTEGGDEVVVTVQNDGSFPERLRTSLYAPFKKGDQRSRGLGLGLFIVREVLTAHGGRITLEGDAARTRFVTRWPRQSSPNQSPKTALNSQ
jgi:signal transduction histidine kinase